MEEVRTMNTLFENIKHIDEKGKEYWLARDLQLTLNYKKWDKFEIVIKKAIEACKGSNYKYNDHFLRVGKMIKIAKGGKRLIDDYKIKI